MMDGKEPRWHGGHDLQVGLLCKNVRIDATNGTIVFFKEYLQSCYWLSPRMFLMRLV
jgi:hypothetical protein